MRKMSQARPPDFTRDTGDTTLSPFQDIAMNIRMHRRKARILCLLLASTSQPLWAHVGPGDEGEPVLTVMLEGED